MVSGRRVDSRQQTRFYVGAGGTAPKPEPCPQIFGYSSSAVVQPVNSYTGGAFMESWSG